MGELCAGWGGVGCCGAVRAAIVVGEGSPVLGWI
jgi:hypothetical protein